MARELYNLFWLNPKYPLERAAGGKLATTNTSKKISTTDGMILFPALFSPLCCSDDGSKVESAAGEWIDLIIATRSPLTKEMVNHQLKISKELDPRKPFTRRALFGGAHEGVIKVSKKPFALEAGTLVYTGVDRPESEAVFRGHLHKSVVAQLKMGFNLVYAVRVHSKALKNAVSYASKRFPGSNVDHTGQYPMLAIGPRAFAGYQKAPNRGCRQDAHGAMRTYEEVVRPLEFEDAIIFQKMLRWAGNKIELRQDVLPGLGTQAFEAKSRGGGVPGINLYKVDPNEPITAYHPVFVSSGSRSFDAPKIGHVSDVHVNCRWDLLAQSPARVIEYQSTEHQAESEKLGKLLATTNDGFCATLDAVIAKDPSILVVGGDLLDHLRNAYSTHALTRTDLDPTEVWDMVKLDPYGRDRYPMGLDALAFFSLMIRAIKRNQLPVYGLAGNHDAYQEAYGISPRVNAGVGLSKANEGIPADLNLTFYEALLAFGPSGGAVKRAFNLVGKQFFWFYMLFTPWSDFGYRFPKKMLVSLDWGETERMVEIGTHRITGQSQDETTKSWVVGGYLPRANNSVGPKQLALLEAGGRAGLSTVVTSHFTLLCYRENVPAVPGTGFLQTASKFNRYEMGTFEDNRHAFVTALTKSGNKIDLMLTGHAHRRGLYTLGSEQAYPVGSFVFSKFPTKFHDPGVSGGLSVTPLRRGTTGPLVVVSDSAGPFPKFNERGEFKGYAGERPGGTVVSFDRAGNVDKVEAVSANSAKPRGVVAVDYLDMSLDEGVKNSFVTIPSPSQEKRGRGTIYNVKLELSEHLATDCKVNVTSVTLAGLVPGGNGKFWRITTTPHALGDNWWEVEEKCNRDMYRWLRGTADGSRFLSVKLSCQHARFKDHFTWDDRWNYEVALKKLVDNRIKQVTYKVTRPSHKMRTSLQSMGVTPMQVWKDAPNFKARAAFYKAARQRQGRG